MTEDFENRAATVLRRRPKRIENTVGDVAVVLVRHGVELAGGDRPRIGDVRWLPPHQAEPLVRNCAADYLTEEVAP